MKNLEAKTTTLVLIDLQKGVMSRQTEPRSAAEVLATSMELAERFREAGATVVLVNVGWSADFKDALRPPVDQPMPMPPGGFPPDFMELAGGLRKACDICITKRQWGAFYGTELDLQLRRRGIRTIVLGGISTNIGVESTAREAWERNYALVFAEDTMASQSAEMHRFALSNIFPRLGQVAKASEINLT